MKYDKFKKAVATATLMAQNNVKKEVIGGYLMTKGVNLPDLTLDSFIKQAPEQKVDLEFGHEQHILELVIK